LVCYLSPHNWRKAGHSKSVHIFFSFRNKPATKQWSGRLLVICFAARKKQTSQRKPGQVARIWIRIWSSSAKCFASSVIYSPFGDRINSDMFAKRSAALDLSDRGHPIRDSLPGDGQHIYKDERIFRDVSIHMYAYSCIGKDLTGYPLYSHCRMAPVMDFV
jgi:hypothetical protein